MELTRQPGFEFVSLTTPAQIDVLVPFGDSFEWYDIALNVGSPIGEAMLKNLMAEQDLFVWRMQSDHNPKLQAYASLSRFAMAEQVYVYCPQGWDNTAVAAGLEALTQAVFADKPECQDVWTCLPTPEPSDSEETLLIMGFTYTPASLDKGRRRTFGLSRDVFSAYHEG